MSIEFNCPNCQKILRTGDDKAGLEAKCPGCGTVVTVPGSGSGAADDEQQFDYDDYGSDDHSADEFSGAGFPQRTGTSGMKSCPMCGEQIKAAAVVCRYCGEDFGDRPYSRGAPRRDSSLATISLVSGISGLVFTMCCGCISLPGGLTGIIALSRIKAGEADGKGMAIAGIVCGAIALLVFVLLLVFGFAMQMQNFPQFNP